MEAERVAICIVTYNAAADLTGCLAAVAALTHRPLEVVIVDCASHDESVKLAHEAVLPEISKIVVPLADNRGFAGGMNEALTHSDAPYILTLNADARPAVDYLDRLLERFRSSGEQIGAVTGRLLRPEVDGVQRLDACGMRLTRTWRHLDRGSGSTDLESWMRPERVFGATGAATLFARRALEDVRFDERGPSMVFDADFHSFREDAELCFRLQERGWDVLFEPAAQAEHRRWNLPSRRRQLPAAVNYHSLKNRYLLRIYHQTGRNFLYTLLPTLARDVLAFIYVLLCERSSFRAYTWLWEHRKELVSRRRWLQQRRRRSSAEVERWFSHTGEPL